MNVLMFGWEFPPHNSGGLGTACYGLTKGLSEVGVSISLVLPRAGEHEASFVKIIQPGEKVGISITHVNSLLTSYITTDQYDHLLKESTIPDDFHIYGDNLFQEIHRFAARAAQIARDEPHEIIHAHDWLTFPAGIQAHRESGKPLVVHVHSTEYDRTGGNGINEHVFQLEREGMQQADAVIAVSNYTKQKIVQHYHIPAEKIHVVHNSIDRTPTHQPSHDVRALKNVLFLGRITLQKGPEYFLQAARIVSDYYPNVRFVMAGAGDMKHRLMHMADNLGISEKVSFTGFLSGQNIDEAYRQADLFVMPSVSEPFGIAALESIMNGTPVIISRQAGVSEIINHCLKVNFWDTHEMAGKIIGVLNYPQLHSALQQNGFAEVSRMSWQQPAEKCQMIYNQVMAGG